MCHTEGAIGSGNSHAGSQALWQIFATFPGRYPIFDPNISVLTKPRQLCPVQAQASRAQPCPPFSSGPLSFLHTLEILRAVLNPQNRLRFATF
eukprot:s1176_g23.t1